jgi:hypothetical protein
MLSNLFKVSNLSFSNDSLLVRYSSKKIDSEILDYSCYLRSQKFYCRLQVVDQNNQTVEVSLPSVGCYPKFFTVFAKLTQFEVLLAKSEIEA